MSYANISKMFTDLKNADGTGIYDRPIRENISDNVNIPTEESLGYHNISRNKQRSD